MSEQQETALSLDNEVFIQCANYIEKILFQYQTIIGADYQGYLNHCKRVAVCCLILAQNKPVIKLRLLLPFMILVFGQQKRLITFNLLCSR